MKNSKIIKDLFQKMHENKIRFKYEFYYSSIQDLEWINVSIQDYFFHENLLNLWLIINGKKVLKKIPIEGDKK